jgi:hypothetical protein
MPSMKTVSWAARAYRGTDVPWPRSQAEIYKMLGDVGIYEIRFTNLRDRFALEFLVQLQERQKPRAIRIIIPLTYRGEDEKQRTKELNIVHRVLINHLKAKFVAIQSGLAEFEQEFMAHLVITDKHGNSRTLGETLLPEYRRSIDEGGNPDFKLLPEPEDG